MKLLLSILLLGCAGVCCGQTGKLPKCSIDGVTFFYEGADGLCHDPRSPQPKQRAVPIQKWVTAETLSKFDSVPEPEPMDVPAIHYPVKSYLISEGCEEGVAVCSNDAMVCSHHGKLPGSKGASYVIGEPVQCGGGWEWTCADKSRVLLTDESGGKHCIKFPK
jgi:hypothetical protein